VKSCLHARAAVPERKTLEPSKNEGSGFRKSRATPGVSFTWQRRASRPKRYTRMLAIARKKPAKGISETVQKREGRRKTKLFRPPIVVAGANEHRGSNSVTTDPATSSCSTGARENGLTQPLTLLLESSYLIRQNRQGSAVGREMLMMVRSHRPDW